MDELDPLVLTQAELQDMAALAAIAEPHHDETDAATLAVLYKIRAACEFNEGGMRVPGIVVTS